MGFIDPTTLPDIQPKPGWHGRFFHSEHMTFVYYDIEPSAGLHLHSHPNEEVWHILEGEVDLTLGEETRCVRAGSAVVIPGGTPHAVSTKERCRVLVVDYPVRHEVAGLKI